MSTSSLQNKKSAVWLHFDFTNETDKVKCKICRSIFSYKGSAISNLHLKVKHPLPALKVTLFGEVDPKTGMIMNMTDLKQNMAEAIMKPMDHKNLDVDVEYFKTKPSTTENLTIFIWNQMKHAMERPELLYEVEVFETENNIVSYRGE